jgi:hypothetical protein
MTRHVVVVGAGLASRRHDLELHTARVRWA